LFALLEGPVDHDGNPARGRCRQQIGLELARRQRIGELDEIDAGLSD
jgi:hypothetical protein